MYSVNINDINIIIKKHSDCITATCYHNGFEFIMTSTAKSAISIAIVQMTNMKVIKTREVPLIRKYNGDYKLEIESLRLAMLGAFEEYYNSSLPLKNS